MVRKARNGIVYPYRVERRKRLSDGTVKIYASYEFKVDGKTYSRKKYVDANKRLTELLRNGQIRQRQQQLHHTRGFVGFRNLISCKAEPSPSRQRGAVSGMELSRAI